MKTKLFTLVVMLFMVASLQSQVLFTENFAYPVGDSACAAYGWNAHSGSFGPILIVSPSLTYTGYNLSGIGNSARLDSAGAIDVNHSFTQQTSGSIYASFMVKVTKARTGEYFAHLTETTVGTTFRLKIFVKDDGANNLLFGVSKSNNTATATYSTTQFSYNTTYLVVAKYKFITGTTTDDEVSLFVFTSPTLPLVEPTTPLLGPITDAGTDLTNAGTIAMRQGPAASSPTLIIDGIKICTSWNSIVSNVTPISTVATDFSLSQNYPNPFNPSTTINFSIAKAGFVTLKVYDINGREVKSLVNNNMTPGQYEVNANLSTLNSGVYFYTINVTGDANFSSTKKLMLVK